MTRADNLPDSGLDGGIASAQARRNRAKAAALDAYTTADYDHRAEKYPDCALCQNREPHHGCQGHTRNGPRTGQPCGATSIPVGAFVCRVHGGNTPQARAAGKERAVRIKAHAEALALGAPITVDPAQALLDLIHAKAGEVAWLRDKVRAVEEDGGDDALVWGRTREKAGGEDEGTTYEAKPNVWWQLLRTAEDQLANYAAAALRAGVEERRVRLAESQGLLVAGAVRRILDALNLTAEQLELVPVVVPRELRAIDAGGAA